MALPTSGPDPTRGQAARLGGPLAGLDRLLQWVVRLVWLNLCWTGLTLLGGIVLGAGPATIAAHVVATRWLQGDIDLPVARTMWVEWRRHFRAGSTATLLAAAITAALALTWRFGGQQSAVTGAISQGLSAVGLVLMAVLVPQLVWVLERTEQTVARTFLTALAAGLRRPLLTLTLLLIGVGWPVALILLGWPGLIPVVGVSVPVVGSAWCVERTYPSTARVAARD